MQDTLKVTEEVAGSQLAGTGRFPVSARMPVLTALPLFLKGAPPEVDGTGDAELPEIGGNVAAQDVDQMGGPVAPERRERIVEGAPQHDEIRALRDGAQDVEPAFDPAVEDQRQRGRGADGGQGVDAGRGRIELPPGMVRDPDRIDAACFEPRDIIGDSARP